MYNCNWCPNSVQYKEEGQTAECESCLTFRGLLSEKEFEEKIFSIINYQFIKAFHKILEDTRKRAKVL